MGYEKGLERENRNKPTRLCWKEIKKKIKKGRNNSEGRGKKKVF